MICGDSVEGLAQAVGMCTTMSFTIGLVVHFPTKKGRATGTKVSCQQEQHKVDIPILVANLFGSSIDPIRNASFLCTFVLKLELQGKACHWHRSFSKFSGES